MNFWQLNRFQAGKARWSSEIGQQTILPQAQHLKEAKWWMVQKTKTIQWAAVLVRQFWADRKCYSNAINHSLQPWWTEKHHKVSKSWDGCASTAGSRSWEQEPEATLSASSANLDKDLLNNKWPSYAVAMISDVLRHTPISSSHLNLPNITNISYKHKLAICW